MASASNEMVFLQQFHIADRLSEVRDDTLHRAMTAKYKWISLNTTEYWIFEKNGPIPTTNGEGMEHFISCPAANQFISNKLNINYAYLCGVPGKYR